MTGKEKLEQAFKHEDGPILFDIGAMPTTGMHCEVVGKLRDFYGLEKRHVKIIEPMQLLGQIEDDLKEAMGIQTSPLWSKFSIFGFRQSDKYKEWRTPWGQDILVSDEFEISTDLKGDMLLYPCGDRNSQPSGRMAEGSYYFDIIDRAPAFDEENYRVEDNFEDFSSVSQEDLDWFKAKAGKLKDTQDVVTGNLGGTAIGDVAMISGPQLRLPKGLRDLTEWYMSIKLRPEKLHEIFSYQTDLAIDNLKKIHAVLGETIQIAYICGTDFGTQNGPFCSRDTFLSLYSPYYRRINGWIHENTSWKTFKHCCGSIYPLISDLVDSGFDILNPVQWTAKDMDKNILKSSFGDRLVFWGGGIDTQKTLPFGTSKDVFKEALECCRIFGKKGGFIFNTIHNIQPGVPVENVAALAEAVRTFNGEQ